MTFSKQAKPTTNFSKTVKPKGSEGARFGIARFGTARFGQIAGFNKVAKSTSSFSKVAKLSVSFNKVVKQASSFSKVAKP